MSDDRCKMSDVRDQMWYVRCQRSDVICQMSGIAGNQISDVKCQMWDVRCQLLYIEGDQMSDVRCQVLREARYKLEGWPVLYLDNCSLTQDLSLPLATWGGNRWESVELSEFIRQIELETEACPYSKVKLFSQNLSLGWCASKLVQISQARNGWTVAPCPI